MNHKNCILRLFVCLWRWYINMTITILDIIHFNLGCLHPVACMRSKWGEFSSTQRYYSRFLIFIIKLTAKILGRMTIFKQKYIDRNIFLPEGGRTTEIGSSEVNNI
jgi:hypothetical protein